MGYDKNCHTVTLCHKKSVTVFHHVKESQVTVYKEDRGFTLSLYYFVTLVTHFLGSFLCSLFSISKSHLFTSYGRDKRDKVEMLLYRQLCSSKSCHKKSVTVCDSCDSFEVLA